ncbi:MAG: TonB family protein [Planctomycetota bacterium]
MTAYVALHFGLLLGLVLLALGLGRVGRRELVHLAWVLVFVKLLVPPFLRIPVLAPALAESPVPLPAPEAGLLDVGLVGAQLLDLDPASAEAVDASVSIAPTTVLLWLWLAGAVVFAALFARSALRCARLVRGARAPSAKLAGAARSAASDLGLAEPPRLRVVDARISPAVVPSRPATIVLPEGLVERLSPAELRLVLMHELAHFSRRDHWVRLLEALAQVAYWWLPGVAWMRARLRASEEACVDARVLRAGGDGRVYANALIRSVEFLQEGSERLPNLATGALAGGSLHERITMIMLERPHRPTGVAWRALFAGGLLALLPLVPARAGAAVPTAAYEPPADPVELAAQQGSEPAVSDDERDAMAAVLALIDAGDLQAALTRLTAPRGPNASALFDFTAASLALQLGGMEQAERDYSIAAEKHPSFLRAWRQLGLVRFRGDDYAAAAEALTRAIALGGGDAATYGMLGAARVKTGEYAGAESAFWMALQLDPASSDWGQGLLSALALQGRQADVVTLSSKLLEGQPDDAALWKLKADACVALGRVDDASSAFARAKELVAAADRASGASASVLFVLTSDGRVVYSGCEIGIDGVRLAVERLLAESPASPVAVQADRDTSSAALVRVIDAIKLAGATNVQIATVGSYGDDFLLPEARKLPADVEVNRGANAVPILRQLPLLDLQDGDALLQLGDSELRAGDVARAISLYERAVQLRGFEADALLRKATALTSVQRYDDARTTLQRCLDLEEGEPVRRYIDDLLVAQRDALLPPAPPEEQQEAVEGEVYSLDDLDSEPRALFQPVPKLTAELRKKGPGTVLLVAVINEKGRIEQLSVQESSDTAFERPAIDALKRWRFLPPMRGGKPVKARLRLPMTFLDIDSKD